MCNNCARIVCKDRDKKEVCKNKISYTKAGILDKPERIEKTNGIKNNRIICRNRGL